MGMEASLQEVSLATLGGGAAIELFDDELKRVLANIGDPNTPADTIREVVLRVRIKPSADRSAALLELACTSKPAPVKAFMTNVFLGTDGTTVKAWENQVVKQGELGLEKVRQFEKGEKA